ncbi:MAG: hypothetical protein GF410_13715 [Chitinivibrionales bacterium]|nr:hypothetical protein [Chitinivibrionales bacterium]
MVREYRIEVPLPEGYNGEFLNDAPSPIYRPRMEEIYNFRIESWGFYFIDRGVHDEVASYALKMFIDEALRLSDHIEIIRIT